jgi:hypothetical protein
MSLAGLLERGVRSVLDEPESNQELGELLATRAMEADSTEHVRQAIEAMPGLLVGIQRALAALEAPAHARELFLVVLSYVIDDHNLIPSHAGRPLYGLLDDVYMLHLAALELEEHLGRIDMRSVAGGAHLLEQVLPRDVVAALRAKVHEARETVLRRSTRAREAKR